MLAGLHFGYILGFDVFSAFRQNPPVGVGMLGGINCDGFGGVAVGGI